VTVGSWNMKEDSDALGYHNLYSDKCLIKAGGKHQASFVQFSLAKCMFPLYFNMFLCSQIYTN
jgi:hypothetical protein